MTTQHYPLFATIPITVLFLNEDGDGETGASGKVYIRRISDDTYWDGASWTATRTALSMTEIDDTESPGYWRYDFDTSTFLDPEEYEFEAVDDNGLALNVPQGGVAIVSGALSDASLARKMLTNRQELADGDTANLITYDDDNVTPLGTQSVVDKNDSPIVQRQLIPAKRTKLT